jgi:hypothetical protein
MVKNLGKGVAEGEQSEQNRPAKRPAIHRGKRWRAEQSAEMVRVPVKTVACPAKIAGIGWSGLLFLHESKIGIHRSKDL